MPTTRYYPKVSNATSYAFLWDLVKFLINDPTATYTGPSWELVQCQDWSASIREAPTDAHDVSTLSAGNAWRAGGVAQYDWAVLRSATGVSGNKFQVYLGAASSTSISVILMPLDNFSLAGGVLWPPTYATPSVGSGSSVVNLTTYSTAANYSVVCDEAMAAILCDDSTNPYWIYFGEVDSPRDNGTPADDRPFVIFDNPSYVDATKNSLWNRVSPVDDSTILTTGGWAKFSYVGGDVHSGGDASLLGVWTVLPVCVYFDDASHKHLAGVLRNIRSGSISLGASGTLDSMNWMYRKHTAATTAVCFKWDGSTAYP